METIMCTFPSNGWKANKAIWVLSCCLFQWIVCVLNSLYFNVGYIVITLQQVTVDLYTLKTTFK